MYVYLVSLLPHLYVYFTYIFPFLKCTCVRMSIAIPSAPSPPRILTVTGTRSGSTVELNWLPPLHPNGAIHYEIEYEPAMTPGLTMVVGGTDLYFNLTLPKEFLTYNVRVVAVSTQGSRSGESNTVSVCPGRNRQGAWYMHKCVHKTCLTSYVTCVHMYYLSCE